MYKNIFIKGGVAYETAQPAAPLYSVLLRSSLRRPGNRPDYLSRYGHLAVSSLSYVLTFVFPGLSLGVFTFLVNCTMLVGQVLLLRHRFQSIQLLQIPATLLFSVCIDLWTELLAPLVPESYGARWWCSCWASGRSAG